MLCYLHQILPGLGSNQQTSLFTGATLLSDKLKQKGCLNRCGPGLHSVIASGASVALAQSEQFIHGPMATMIVLQALSCRVISSTPVYCLSTPMHDQGSTQELAALVLMSGLSEISI